MAFKTNKVFNLKGIIFQVLLVIPLIVSTNIDCNGKPFYCINSTHFMICVDLGGGVSSTVDNFVIPCPPTTVCQRTNSFECEFAPTTPRLEVIPSNGAHNIEVNASTPLPDVTTTTSNFRTTNGILFEDTFITVSTKTVTENEAVQLITRPPGEIITKPFGNEKESKFNSISTPYIESGLEISTNISDIKDIEVNISKEPIDQFSDKNSEIIAIANHTYDNGKEPITENLLTVYNNDIIPTEALVITTNSSHLELFSLNNTVNTPTEDTTTDISVTTDITTNAASLKLESGEFQNKTFYYETNSDLPSTETVLFENNTLTNEITTMLPAYEITTDRPVTTIEDFNLLAMKYDKIDIVTTTEMYHDTIMTDNLSKNYSSIGNDTFIEILTTKNLRLKNNEIIETGHVVTVNSGDITTTDPNDYYETVQTTQLYYETITETLNSTADVNIMENTQSDVLAVSNRLNIGTGIISEYEVLANTDAITTMPLVSEIPSNSTKSEGITSAIGNIVINNITSNSTETASVIFTAGSNINKKNKNVDYTTESLELKNLSPSLKENVETNMSIMKLLKGETVTAMVTSEVQTSTDTLFSFKHNTTDSIATTDSVTIDLIQVNITSSVTNSEVLQNDFTIDPTITISGVNNTTESLLELNLSPTDINSTQSKSFDVQETPITAATEVASRVFTSNKSGAKSTTSQIKYELQNATNILNMTNTDNVRQFKPIAHEHSTNIITNDLSTIDLNKQNNGAPTRELPMSLLQDIMAKSLVGQVEDNFSKKIKDRTTQLMNKKNLQTEIVTPLFVTVQDNPETKKMPRNTTNEPTLIFTEDSIITPPSNLEIQSSQSNPMESLLFNNTSKEYVNISVQPGELSKLVMTKVTTPNLIDTSYFVNPNTTKSFQVLLNKSENSVTETIQQTYVQHNEPITKMSQHIDKLSTKMITNSFLHENMNITETATSSPNVDEITPPVSLLMNLNNKEDKKKNTVIYTTLPKNENTFQINNINVRSDIPSSDLYYKSGTIIQPSNFSLSIILDATGSIQKNLNKSEQINNSSTNIKGDSSPLPTNYSRSGFQNVSDVQVQSLTTKDIAESLPLTKYISDSKIPQSKQSLNVNAPEIETKYNRTKTMNTTNINFHGTTDQINKTNFNCTNYTRGRYADKKNCRKFYICVGNLQPIEGICPVGTVFSEIRKQCTKNLTQCIKNNQFVCTSEGRFRDFLMNNIYYICIKNVSVNNHFIRFKLQCQNGYYLNQTSIKCIPDVVTESNQFLSSNQSVSLNSENSNIYVSSTQSTTIRSMEIKIPSRNKFMCEDEGKFADPNNCRKYYICYKNSKSVLKRKEKECDSDEVFDKDTKKCKDFESF